MKRSITRHRIRIPIVWLSSLFVSTQVVANAVDDLAPGHWLEVLDSRLEAVDPEDDPSANPDWPGTAPWHGVEGQRGVIDDWSSAAFDTLRGRLVIWGGGHGGYAGNEVYAFDVESLAWQRLTDPSTDVSVNGSTLYADGKPRSRETYNYLEYVADIDRMVSFGGGNLYPGANVTTELAAFDFASVAWDTVSLTAHPGSPYAMFGAMAVVDGDSGHVFFKQTGYNALHRYDPLTDTWSSHGGYNVLQYRNAAIDWHNRYFVWTGRHGSTVAYDLQTPSMAASLRPTTGDTEIQSVDFPGMDYDPVSRRIIAWGGGAAVYALDTDSWIWTRIDPDPANTVAPTPMNRNGTHGRFRYVPSKNAFVLVNDVAENVYFFKLPVHPDSDSDGIADSADNCSMVANADQCDSDGDGFGNRCDGDLDNNGIVNSFDLTHMRLAFGASGEHAADLDCNAAVNSFDLAVMRGLFGKPPGPGAATRSGVTSAPGADPQHRQPTAAAAR